MEALHPKPYLYKIRVALPHDSGFERSFVPHGHIVRGASNPNDGAAFAAGVRWKSEKKEGKREAESHLLVRSSPRSVGLPSVCYIHSFPE